MDHLNSFDTSYKEFRIKYSELVVKFDHLATRNEQLTKQLDKKGKQLVKIKEDNRCLNEQLTKKDEKICKLRSQLVARMSNSKDNSVDDGTIERAESKISKLKLQLKVKDDEIKELADLNKQLTELADDANKDLEDKMKTDLQFMEKIDHLQDESRKLRTKLAATSDNGQAQSRLLLNATSRSSTTRQNITHTMAKLPDMPVTDDEEPKGNVRRNFSVQEELRLVAIINELGQVLSTKGRVGVLNVAKKQAWADITDKYNATLEDGQITRTIPQLVKKWENMTILNKKEMARNRQPRFGQILAGPPLSPSNSTLGEIVNQTIGDHVEPLANEFDSDSFSTILGD